MEAIPYYESLKNWASSLFGRAAAPAQAAAPAFTTTQGSTSWFGTAPETPGYTSAGGRRRAGRTRRHRSKHGKSRRR